MSLETWLLIRKKEKTNRNLSFLGLRFADASVYAVHDKLPQFYHVVLDPWSKCFKQTPITDDTFVVVTKNKLSILWL